VSNKGISDLTGIRKFINLEELWCFGKQLSKLDVSRNFELWNLFFENMPSLTAICVWELPFPPEGLTVYMEESPNADFTTECTHQN